MFELLVSIQQKGMGTKLCKAPKNWKKNKIKNKKEVVKVVQTTLAAVVAIHFHCMNIMNVS